MRADLTTSDSQEAGFTLVEVLVSMFIFSLISVGALIALSATLDARERAQARIEQIERLAAARRIMADDFATMVIRQNRDGLGGFEDRQRIIETDRFELTRRGRANPDGAFARGDLLRVSWRVENGALIRAFLPHENPAYIELPLDRVVLEGVESLRVDRVDPSVQSVQQLLSSLAPQPGLLNGAAVAITLTHQDGETTRHVFEIPQ